MNPLELIKDKLRIKPSLQERKPVEVILKEEEKDNVEEEDKDKKVKYGISIDQHLFDKMKNEGVGVSKFIQKLVKEYYDGKNM
jgi:hypothetical protein